MRKKVLITNYSIAQFSGSEINSATIAKQLKLMGYEVYMLALEFSAPLYPVVKENFDHIINPLNDKFEFTKNEFDIVWAHHTFLLDWLIFEKELKAKKIITSSLSPVEPFESAPIYANDLCFSLANSQETKEQLEDNENISRVYLFENYSFKSYFNKNIEIKSLKNIAVVSNHIPQELNEAIIELRDRKYNVEIYGFQGIRELVTDKILEKYDCIITIGKTVQYAMSLGIPVYIYDIHGGEGFLNMKNIEINRAHNFSGRGFSKKSSNEIVNEVIFQFKNAIEETDEIKKYAMKNFCFEDKINEIIEYINQSQEVDLINIRKKYRNYRRNLLITKKIAELYSRKNDEKMKEREIEFYKIKDEELLLKDKEINNRGYLIKVKDEEIERVDSENKKLKLMYEEKRKELEAIKNSRCWRYTKIFRKNNNDKK